MKHLLFLLALAGSLAASGQINPNPKLEKQRVYWWNEWPNKVKVKLLSVTKKSNGQIDYGTVAVTNATPYEIVVLTFWVNGFDKRNQFLDTYQSDAEQKIAAGASVIMKAYNSQTGAARIEVSLKAITIPKIGLYPGPLYD